MVQVKNLYGATGEDASTGDSVDRMNPSFMKSVAGAPEESAEGISQRRDGSPEDPLSLAKSMYEDSTEFMESSLRHRWERAERSFQNRHPAGSKYFSEQYKTKSKLFRPKTRAMLRSAEANAATSFFSNMDPVNVVAVNQGDKDQVISAEIHKELLKYRLTTPNQRVAIPWFLTVVGAMQDTQKYGVVASKQYWSYEETTYEEVIEYDDGTSQVNLKRIVTRDRPCVDLIPPENVRIDRGADWRDPVNSSPFVIMLHPMYVHEVMDKMRSPDKITGKTWKRLDQTTLLKAATREAWDSTRQTREGNREDSKESQIDVDEYKIVWVHENIAQWDGIDWIWFTAGVYGLLSDPVPIQEVYPHLHDGERPVVMGYNVIETNRLYPSSKIDLTAGLQAEANEIVNQRLDNVKLALNKRYFARRGGQVDLRSLLRNSSGSVTLMNDVEADVKVVDTRDVTASSYQEQDRINVDFDEIGGQFSAGTVQTNRRLNETVGGMELLSGSANSVAELDLRVFSETWVQPVLQQVVRMEAYYENDRTILALAGENAQIFRKYGVDSITDQLLDQDVTVRVNVGIGATDPVGKLKRFMMGAEMIGQIVGPQIQSFVNHEEVIKEIMGALGYQDGERFFNFRDQDPRMAMLMEQIQKMQQLLESKQLDNETKVKVAEVAAMSRVLAQQIDTQGRQQMSAESGQQDYNTQALRGQQQMQQALMEAMQNAAGQDRQQQMDLKKMSLDAGIKLTEQERKAELEREKIKAQAELLAKRQRESQKSKPSNGASKG